ncbi:MAG: hypothetical protein C5B49_10775 [Bdellovibrio sp.]|nr:MAG: hypothetical protein C5B49_10775 [Bdellovibrio sp.]
MKKILLAPLAICVVCPFSLQAMSSQLIQCNQVSKSAVRAGDRSSEVAAEMRPVSWGAKYAFVAIREYSERGTIGKNGIADSIQVLSDLDRKFNSDLLRQLLPSLIERLASDFKSGQDRHLLALPAQKNAVEKLLTLAVLDGRHVHEIAREFIKYFHGEMALALARGLAFAAVKKFGFEDLSMSVKEFKVLRKRLTDWKNDPRTTDFAELCLLGLIAGTVENALYDNQQLSVIAESAKDLYKFYRVLGFSTLTVPAEFLGLPESWTLALFIKAIEVKAAEIESKRAANDVVTLP